MLLPGAGRSLFFISKSEMPDRVAERLRAAAGSVGA